MPQSGKDRGKKENYKHTSIVNPGAKILKKVLGNRSNTI